jgi:RNA polymerase sigma-70 factor, ECF subfamily
MPLFHRQPAVPEARPAPLEDSELVERVREGDASAYDELVNRHMRRAFSVAYRLMGHREDAEDLVQDAFLIALEKIDTFQAGRGFGPWFYRILVNRGLNTRKARSVRRTEELPTELTAIGPLPDRAAEQAELKEQLEAALARLPEKQRVAVQLFELEGFAGAEIAEILEIPAGTVRYHLHQARQSLRDALKIFHPKEA